MVAKKPRGLGKGLEALLGGSGLTETAVESQLHPHLGEGEGPADGSLRKLPIEKIRRGRYQPRIDMHPDTLEELADSIRAQGVVQPIVVRPTATKGEYELIAGERRWRAAQIAGLDQIPAVIREVNDQAAMAMGLIENIQREALNPIEEAIALHRLIEEFGMTHQQTADAVGRSRAAVTNLLRLLGLRDDVKRLVENGDLEMGHARALLPLEGPAQSEAARTVVARGLSVRDTEALVKKLQQEASAPPVAPKRSDPDVAKLEQQVSERLGAKVELKHGKRGNGKLVIQYHSLDELDGILERIK